MHDANRGVGVQRVALTTYELIWPDGQKTTVKVDGTSGKKVKVHVAGARRGKFASLHDYTTGAAIDTQLRMIMAENKLRVADG